MALTISNKGISSPSADQRRHHVRSPQQANASVASERLKSDQVHFGDLQTEQQQEQPTPAAPVHEGLFTRIINRIGRFFKYLGKAVQALFGTETPKPISKIIGKELGTAIEAREKDPAFQEAMVKTGEALDSFIPVLETHPDLHDYVKDVKEQSAQLKSPEGRQALLGNVLMHVVETGQAEQGVQVLLTAQALQPIWPLMEQAAHYQQSQANLNPAGDSD